MTTDLASKAVFDFGYVRNVIEMAVRKEQELWIDIPRDQPIASSVGGVEKNPSFRGLNQIAIRLEDPAAKRFVNNQATVPGASAPATTSDCRQGGSAAPRTMFKLCPANLASSKGLLGPSSQD
jgi:hypothetical protein